MIPTEPIGSIPRPLELIAAVARGDSEGPALDVLYDDAIRDTIARFEETGSPVITDGEQRKYQNFWTYSVHGLPNTAPDGFKIPFSAGHTRRMPRLTSGPFRYKRQAGQYLDVALRYTKRPVKQAVISPSALSLMYPAEGIPGYSRDEFIHDLLAQHEQEIRQCLAKGAHKVQIDFTEGRLAVKIDPSGNLLNSFIDLNNLALSRFTSAERAKIGVHTCPGGDLDSTHSAEVDYAALLPSLFQMKVGNFYIALAGEPDRGRVLEIIREHMKPEHRVFVGVVAPIDPEVETAEGVRDRVLEAAEFIPVGQLGTTDDCGFSPFSDDTSTTRDMAFAKIRARVEGTALDGRLQQVIWNLLSNAVKFTPRGGTITVRVSAVGSIIRLTVEDDGQGIDPAYLPHVYDTFSQEDGSTTRSHEGIGIGLSIARSLIALHGGTIRAASEGIGRGATFTVDLPILESAVVMTPEATRASVAAKGNEGDELPDLEGLRVIVIDDQPYTRDVLAAIFHRVNAVARTAESVHQGLELLHGGPADVVICDLAMPDEDGFAFIRALRSLRHPLSATPVIALTAFGRPEDRQRTLAAGFDGYLKKPVDPADLATTVLHLAQRR